MRALIQITGFILVCMAGLSTHLAIVYTLYEWLVTDLGAKQAALEGLKIWVVMVAMIVPGGLLISLAD